MVRLAFRAERGGVRVLLPLPKNPYTKGVRIFTYYLFTIPYYLKIYRVRIFEVKGNSEEGISETCIIKMDYQKSENMI